MNEAMEQVKNELGQDAVILHTKKVKEGGILGYGSKEVVEVTAAVDEDAKPARPKRKDRGKDAPAKIQPETAPRMAPPPTPILPSSILSKYKTDGTEKGIELAKAMGVPQEKPMAMPSFPLFDTKPLAAADPGKPKHLPEPPAAPQPFREIGGNTSKSSKQAATAEGKSRIIKADEPTDKKILPIMPTALTATSKTQPAAEPTATVTPATVAPPPPPMEDTAKIQDLEDQLAQMKSLLAQVISKEPLQDVLSLQETLKRQEVDKNILDDLAAKSGVGETLADAKTPGAHDTLKKYLEQTMNFSAGIKLEKQGSRIVALIGPTGVGKTTTLAKIAARFVLEQGVSAALITADTYRISAVEQLKTYSDILGLPLEIVYSPNELRLAIRKHEEKQLVLIDTAGRSQHNEYQMKELQDLLKTNSRIEKHLVISSTTKNRDAQDILEKFSVCRPDRIIFTKTDETNSTGLILNLLYKKEIGLSYLANGQSVPDDIVPADADKLTEILLR